VKQGKQTVKPSVRILLALPALLLAALALPGAPASAAGDTNWPQWRGPEGSGVSAERGLPEEWGEAKNVRWKTPLPGKGHSSPVVWGRRVFVTTAVEGAVVPGAKAAVHKIEGQEWRHPDSVGADRRHAFKVIALDRDTGRVVWEQTAWEGTPYDDRHRKSSYAASTPATDGRMVYAYFGTEGLYAYDFGGRLAWKFMPGKIGTLGMGAATSPVLHENLVIVQADEEEGKDSFIVGLDKKTGKVVWRTPRKVQVSWATPLLVDTGKRTELIASGTESVISYDPATGKELWRSKGLESNAIPSPVATQNHDMVVVSAGFPAKLAYAVRLGASGELKDADIVWKYGKGTAYVPSPILYGDYVYLLTDKGIMTCLDARTGEVKYEGARVPVPATFTASPIAFEGKILLTSEDGDTFVIRAGPKHEVLRTNSLGEPVYASPAAAGGRLFIRGEKNLYAIERAAK
jgi:outer membrane protein assembly factor BamB